MFADLQIFTALAILIGAYASMGCDIVAYHWQYMIYLAWLASVTHLASLSFLRNHLANNLHKCVWRLSAMCVIQILLSVAVGLATTFDGEPWLNSKGGRPAICYFKGSSDIGTVTFQSAIKMIILLVWGFLIRIAKTFERFEGGLRKLASRTHERSRILRYGANGEIPTPEWDPGTDRSLIQPFKIAIFAVLSIQLDILTSFLAEVSYLPFLIMGQCF